MLNLLFKRIILKILNCLGIFNIVGENFKKQGYVPILLYHCVLKDLKVNSGKSSFYLLGNAVTAAGFEKQMQYLKKKYKVLTLDEYIKRRKNNQDLTGCAVVTFDDGFKNFGREILEKLNIPVTIFLFGDSFNNICDSHMGAILLDASNRNTVNLNFIETEQFMFFLKKEAQKKKLIFLITKRYRKFSTQARKSFTDRLKQVLEIKKEFMPEDVYLTEKEIMDLKNKGFSFAAHGMKHRKMDLLPKNKIEQEIQDSFNFIKRIYPGKDVAFAIPLGFYNENIVSVLKKNNFSCNVTSCDGLNAPDEDIFNLKRVYMNVKNFDEFIFKITGSQMLFRKFFNF